MTAVANSTLTAAQWNLHVRDNLLETAPAKATAAGRIFVSTGVNAIAERGIFSQTVPTQEGSGSTSYTDLTTVGPAVTVGTGTMALVWVNCASQNSDTTNSSPASVAVSGATTIAAADAWATYAGRGVANRSERTGVCHLFTGLTPGTHTFTMKYRVTGGSGLWNDRSLIVMGL